MATSLSKFRVTPLLNPPPQGGYSMQTSPNRREPSNDGQNSAPSVGAGQGGGSHGPIIFGVHVDQAFESRRDPPPQSSPTRGEEALSPAATPDVAGRAKLGKDSARAPTGTSGGQRLHRRLDAVGRQREHPPLENLGDHLGRLRIGPVLLRSRIDPDRARPGRDRPLQPHPAGLRIEVLDRAARRDDLVGAHRRVADEDDAIVAPVGVDEVAGGDPLLVPAAVVLPHALVQAIVEVEMLEPFELALSR